MIFAIVVASFVFSSCSTEDMDGSADYTSISVKLSSTSELYHSVYLDVQDVQILVGGTTEETSRWESLGAINQGVYDFTDMNNNDELILVENLVIPIDHVHSVKLVLGDDNAMTMNNILYAIDTPTEAHKQSVNTVDRLLKPNMSYEFTLQFELDNSIQIEGMDVTLVPKMNTEMRLYELF